AAIGDLLGVLDPGEVPRQVPLLHLGGGLALGLAPVDLPQPVLGAAEGERVVLADDAGGLLVALQRRGDRLVPVNGREVVEVGMRLCYAGLGQGDDRGALEEAAQVVVCLTVAVQSEQGHLASPRLRGGACARRDSNPSSLV